MSGKHGGARPGSGRKATGLAAPVGISFRLTQAEAAALDALCLDGEERGSTARRIVREAIQRGG